MPTETPSAELEVTVQIDDLLANWKRIGYLANYLAEYVAYDFLQRERAENLLSTITNELLEAVVHLAPEQSALQLHCVHLGDSLRLDVKHQVKPELISNFVLFVAKLEEGGGEQAYLQMLTTDVKPDVYFNQLGLMILYYDFEVHLSLNTEQDEVDGGRTTSESTELNNELNNRVHDQSVLKNLNQNKNYFNTHIDVSDKVFSK